MPSFKPVKSTDDIKLSDQYREVAKFNSKDRPVTHKGHTYQILSKHERNFTTFERSGRVALGVLAIIGTFGFWLLNKKFRKFVGKLFTKEQKTVRFAVPLNTQSPIKKMEVGGLGN